jgi:hypothetical protein
MGQTQSPQNQKLPSLKSNLNQIQDLLKGSNPNSIVQNIVSKNPQLKNVMQLFNSSNMTPKQFFYQYAQQRGIDPDQFLNS